MFFPESGVGGLAFPADLAEFVSDFYRSKGVNVRSKTLVKGVERGANRVEVVTGSGERIVVDRLVAGIGIHPNVELAEQAGLAVENGVIVDKYLRTSDNDIFAAGDAANFFNPTINDRLRVEHEDNANHMGKLAGRNMALDEPEEYDYLPYFYSDMFELGYEAVGELSSKLEIVADWIEQPYKKGVVYYLRDGSVRGVLLWNVWDRLDAARELIGATGPFSERDLIGRIS
jgi:NADPH-dependent 2,4-dienoyl-CoA reductase/sulfur reductase-like enzyme